jgi:hypothetical protein
VACLLTFLLQEIIGILLGISTFADLLYDRKVVLYSDNKGLLRRFAKLPLHGARCQVLSMPPLAALPRRLIIIRSFMRSGLSSCGTEYTYGLREFHQSTTSVIRHHVVSTKSCMISEPVGANQCWTSFTLSSASWQHGYVPARLLVAFTGGGCLQPAVWHAYLSCLLALWHY